MKAKQLKAKLDKVFSIYIRNRQLDEHGLATCFTCGVKKLPREMHAGHFMSRAKNSTRFDEVNVQVQCPKCNLWGQGEQYQFGLKLDSTYGTGTAERIRQQSHQTRRITAAEYQDLIDHYQGEVKKQEGRRTR